MTRRRKLGTSRLSESTTSWQSTWKLKLNSDVGGSLQRHFLLWQGRLAHSQICSQSVHWYKHGVSRYRVENQKHKVNGSRIHTGFVFKRYMLRITVHTQQVNRFECSVAHPRFTCKRSPAVQFRTSSSVHYCSATHYLVMVCSLLLKTLTMY